MKKLTIILMSFFLATGWLYAEDKVLVWDDTTDFPFGGDFMADGSEAMTGDLNMGENVITNTGNPKLLVDIGTSNIVVTNGAYIHLVMTNVMRNVGGGTYTASGTNCSYACPIAGDYAVDFSVCYNTNVQDKEMYAAIYTNGTRHKVGTMASAGNYPQPKCSVMVYAPTNGFLIEPYVQQVTGTNCPVIANDDFTWMSIHYVP